MFYIVIYSHGARQWLETLYADCEHSAERKAHERKPAGARVEYVARVIAN